MDYEQIYIKQFNVQYIFKFIKFIYNMKADKEIIKYYQYFWKSEHSFLFMLLKLFYLLFLSGFHKIGKILLGRYMVIFIVYDEDRVIGLAHMEFNSSQRYLNGLLGIVLNRDVFGTGIGKRLMQVCIGYCIENSKRKIELSVFKDNVRAISFYKKIGFIMNNTTNLKDSIYNMELDLLNFSMQSLV